MASAVTGIGGAVVVKPAKRDTVAGSAISRRNEKPNTRATGGRMASAEVAHKKRVIPLADALEILSANLGMLVRAGARVEHVVEGGVLTIQVYGVAEARDDEGVYFVPAAAPVLVPEEVTIVR
jgi:hypothetical protein